MKNASSVPVGHQAGHLVVFLTLWKCFGPDGYPAAVPAVVRHLQVVDGAECLRLICAVVVPACSQDNLGNRAKRQLHASQPLVRR